MRKIRVDFKNIIPDLCVTINKFYEKPVNIQNQNNITVLQLRNYYLFYLEMLGKTSELGGSPKRCLAQ